MSYMYFGKVNINSNIFEVYNNPSKIGEILKYLFEAIDQEKRLKVDEKNNIWAKFINIEKDYAKQYISGRIVKIFEDDIETYDAITDDVSPLPNKDLAKSVPFFFDFRNEIVVFTTTNGFRSGKVVDYFNKLINSYSKDIKFEVFLMQNIKEIKEQISKFKKISRVEYTLVPPNSNKDDFMDLFPHDYDEITEIGATKIEQSFSTSAKGNGVNIASRLFNRVIKAVSMGYGIIKLSGKNKENAKLDITSEETAPYKEYIPETQKNSITEIKERGRAGIVTLLANREKNNNRLIDRKK